MRSAREDRPGAHRLPAIGLWSAALLAAAGGGAQEAPELAASRASSEIVVDGRLEEPAWADALSIPLPYEYLPGDNVAPPVATECLVTYDDRALYVAFRAADPEPAAIRAHLMDRDQVGTFVQDDHVVLMIDPFNDERRAFQFRVNPLGVQMDAVYSEVDSLEDFSFDMIWESAAQIHDGGWDVEMAIPLNQLRFPRTSGEQVWGFDIGRSYPRNQRHRIAAHRRDREVSCGLCQVLKVSGFEGIEPGRNLEIVPTATFTRNDAIDTFPDGELRSGDPDTEPGVTARWGVTPNVSLLATVNPDFSQVEADVAQLAVNQRFALFFPEKRPFFLEGIDFFSTPIDAVFTRTVADPEWGLKVTGKEGRDAFGVFVARDEVTGLLFPSNEGSSQTLLDLENDIGVVRYRRDVGANSTVGLLYTAREGDGYSNRVGGFDGFFRLGDNDTVDFQWLRSETDYPDAVAADFGQPSDSFEGDAWQISYDHIDRDWLWFVDAGAYDAGFRADGGFVRRVDIREADGVLIRRWWGGEEAWWTRADVGAFVRRVEDDSGQLTDERYDLFANFAGPLQSFGEISLERNKERFGGVLYEDLDRAQVFYQIFPSGAVKVSAFVDVGDTIDFANNRRAEQLFAAPSIETKIGRHWNLKLDHTYQQLDVEGGRLFEANLTQLRAIYNINIRSFVRAIFQFRTIERNPALFDFPVEPERETLFTQLLFSYKINPQTVLFAGYTDNRLGLQGIDLTETNRTLFVKLGYAWIL